MFKRIAAALAVAAFAVGLLAAPASAAGKPVLHDMTIAHVLHDM